MNYCFNFRLEWLSMRVWHSTYNSLPATFMPLFMPLGGHFRHVFTNAPAARTRN